MTEDRATLKPFISRISELLKTLGQEEGGIHLIATFMRRQIQPLRLRSHPMWADEGPSDPNRMFASDLSDEEVVQKVKSITSLRVADPCNVKCPVTPYGADNRLPEVNVYIRVYFLFLALYCLFEFCCVQMSLLCVLFRVTLSSVASLLWSNLDLMRKQRTLMRSLLTMPLKSLPRTLPLTTLRSPGKMKMNRANRTGQIGRASCRERV